MNFRYLYFIYPLIKDTANKSLSYNSTDKYQYS